jgi:hypothetical protein
MYYNNDNYDRMTRYEKHAGTLQGIRESKQQQTFYSLPITDAKRFDISSQGPSRRN